MISNNSFLHKIIFQWASINQTVYRLFSLRCYILRPAGKLEQLTHAMSRYLWNIVGPCEMRWKNFGEMSTEDGHKVYFSGEEERHEYGVGFLVHKAVVDSVLRCRPVSSRLISIRVRSAPFNITIIQVYAPTSGHDDSEVDHFY